MENEILVITQEEGRLKLNYEEVKEYLNGYLEEYRTACFSEESKTTAKAIVAKLRKEKKSAADALRKRKNEYLEPWLAVEEQAKELIAMFDEPINNIDGWIKAGEEERREAKRKIIRQIYDECVGEISEYLPLEKIYDLKWENATVSRKSIQEAMMSLAYSVTKAVETIKGMNSDAVEKALLLYRQNLSLSDAVAYINNYEQQKAEIQRREQERIRREEEERIRREERERIEAERRAEAQRLEAVRKVEEEKQEQLKKAEEEKAAALRQAEEEKQAAVAEAKAVATQEVIDGLIPDVEGETRLFEYRMALTEDAREKLELYMDSVGIEWEMISHV